MVASITPHLNVWKNSSVYKIIFYMHFRVMLPMLSNKRISPQQFLRRDVGMLGLIHERVLGLAHPAFERLLPLQPSSFYEANMGNIFIRHNKQIYNHNRECSNNALFNRSIFGLVYLYNRLPQRIIIDKNSVSTFQSELTHIAKRRCTDGIDGWQYSFNACYHANHFFTVTNED